MNHVLITGASGFLGKYIVESLSRQGWHITSIGRQAANTIQADLASEVPDLRNYAPNLVVHAMGRAHTVPANPAEAAVFYEVNFGGTQRLCSALDKAAALPKQFVFISTVAVYGRDEGEGIDESHPLLGKTPYALSKIRAEQWLQKWCSERNIVLSILRLPLIAGINAPGNLGAMVKGIRTGRYFNIEKGKARKSMVLASDVAQWIPTIAAVGGIYNLTDKYHPSFAELAAVLAKQLQCNPPRNLPSWIAFPAAFAGNFLGNRAPINFDKLRKITATLTFSDEHATQVFGWQPSPVLKAVLVGEDATKK